MEVRKGKKEDAEFLAQVVTEAMGPELCLGLAESVGRLPLVKQLFATLAAMDESQYSYKNAFIADDSDGNPVGGIIAYDGELLHKLRLAFIREANIILGWNVKEEEAENWGDEADRGEIYLDSLYVAPHARKRGVASSLLEAVNLKFKNSAKPLGLLVEPENTVAIATYKKWGFIEVGVSNFFYNPMIHMQLYI